METNESYWADDYYEVERLFIVSHEADQLASIRSPIQLTVNTVVQ
jgi:hypothetical protein